LVFVRKSDGQSYTSFTILGVKFPRGDDECTAFAMYYIIDCSITDFCSPLPPFAIVIDESAPRDWIMKKTKSENNLHPITNYIPVNTFSVDN